MFLLFTFRGQLYEYDHLFGENLSIRIQYVTFANVYLIVCVLLPFWFFGVVGWCDVAW